VNILRFRGMDDAKSVNCFSERLDSSKEVVADVLLLSAFCSRSSAERGHVQSCVEASRLAGPDAE
jgi:hypothetical protein